ncbi:hypothetical protein EK904_003858, partial [Melospiza melodia maxima]
YSKCFGEQPRCCSFTSALLYHHLGQSRRGAAALSVAQEGADPALMSLLPCREKALPKDCDILSVMPNLLVPFSPGRKGLKGGTGFPVYVGDSKNRHNLPVCEKLCGHLKVGAARNSFSEIMDKLNLIMETVPLVYSKCTTDLEKESLSGILSSMKNKASLQKAIFEFTERLHAEQIEPTHCTYNLQNSNGVSLYFTVGSPSAFTVSGRRQRAVAWRSPRRVRSCDVTARSPATAEMPSQLWHCCGAGSRCPPTVPARHSRGRAASGQLQKPAADCRNRNQSEMDPVEHLRLKVHNLEEKNLELNNQHNQEVSRCEKEVMNLRLELEKGEVLRQDLQSEMSLARKTSEIQLYSAEDKLSDVKSKLLELQVLNDKYQQKEAETAEMIQSSQWQWKEEQQRFAVDRDNILREYLGRMEFLIKEKAERERACKETNAALNSIARKLKDMEAEHDACSKIVKLQAKCLDFKNTRQEYLIKELELRIQELEGALNEEQHGTREAFSGVSRKDFRESENAHERGKKKTNAALQSIAKKLKDMEAEHNGCAKMSRYEKEILQLRLELEKGELLRQNLESELKFARKEANLQLYSAEDELCDAKTKVMEL